MDTKLNSFQKHDLSGAPIWKESKLDFGVRSGGAMFIPAGQTLASDDSSSRPKSRTRPYVARASPWYNLVERYETDSCGLRLRQVKMSWNFLVLLWTRRKSSSRRRLPGIWYCFSLVSSACILQLTDEPCSKIDVNAQTIVLKAKKHGPY